MPTIIAKIFEYVNDMIIEHENDDCKLLHVLIQYKDVSSNRTITESITAKRLLNQKQSTIKEYD